MLTTQQQEKAIDSLLKKKQNALCADCNGKTPCWASLDFGVFICMNCSGAHRALGPSTTRVRSTKLDTWNRDWLDNMKIGNSVLNEYWESQLVGVSKAAKPNINTPLNEIIKFVQDKYVKKKYADPNEALDPLKRYKMGLTQGEVQQKVPQKVVVKEVPKVPVKNNVESPFNAFNNLVANKQKPQRKSSDNLITFDKEAPKVDNLLMEPTSAPVHSKYNHNQFHTVSGTKAKEDENLINFDNLLKNHQPQPQTHNNYQINSHPNHFQHAGHYSAGHFNSQMPHYNQHVSQFDRAQYVTMNINMNMYPKVMNVNVNPQTTNNYINPQPVQPVSQDFSSQFLGQTPQQQPTKPQANEAKITLDSNINLSTFQEKKEQSKSWIDDWK